MVSNGGQTRSNVVREWSNVVKANWPTRRERARNWVRSGGNALFGFGWGQRVLVGGRLWLMVMERDTREGVAFSHQPRDAKEDHTRVMGRTSQCVSAGHRTGGPSGEANRDGTDGDDHNRVDILGTE